jgi:hypothetical protein
MEKLREENQSLAIIRIEMINNHIEISYNLYVTLNPVELQAVALDRIERILELHEEIDKLVIPLVVQTDA